MFVTIRRYERIVGDFVDLAIQTEDIQSFGITNGKEFCSNGNFKKFIKKVFIRTKDGRYYSSSCNIGNNLEQINVLKELFKGKYIISKTTEEVCKDTRRGIAIRKATDWTYTIN